MYESAKQAAFKHIHSVPGGMHNDTWLKGGKEYLYAIKDFLEKTIEHRINKENSNRNYIGGANNGAVSSQ